MLLTLEAVLSGFNSDAGRAALRQAKIEFGDWYYLHGYKTDALTKYREAIRLMSTAEIEATFAQPQALHLPHPGNPGQVLVRSESERPPGRGNIEVPVSVSSRGSISGRPRIVSLTPADVVPFKYVRAVRFGVYRPAIVDGKFRKSKDFRIRFAFDH